MPGGINTTVANSTPATIGGSSAAPAPAPSINWGALNMTPTPPSNQAVLVSSAPARSATAANVTKLQTITTPPAQTTTPSTTGGGTGTGTGNTQNPAPSMTPSDGGAVVNEATARSLLGTDFTGATKNADGTYTLDKTAMARISSGATPGNSSGTGTGTDQYSAAVAGISDPGLAAMYKTSLQNLDSQISQAQSNITSIKARSLNDPAITGVVTAIQGKYQQLIDAMKARNTQLIGRANTSVAAFGGLGVMSQDFLNNEQSQADQRVQNLQDQEDSAIAKAQAAYLAQNDKDLNAAMTEYDKVNKDKMDALNQLLTASSKAVTEAQAQQKIDMQATKDAQTADINQSTKVANGIAQNALAAGLSLNDPTQLQAYVNNLATTYGINDPNILYSAVTTEMAKVNKDALAAQNTQSEMATREKNLANAQERTAIALENASKPKKQTAAEVKDDFYSGLVQLDGKTSSDGTPYYYTARDGQRYLTAVGFSKILDAAKQDGISRANFIKDNPDKFDPNGLDGYKLTAKEKAVIQQ